MSFWRSTDKLVKFLEHITMGLGMLAIVSIMGIVSFDTMRRYIFNAPLQWSYDFISLYLMIIIAYLPLSTTYREGNHVGVTLFVPMFPRMIQRLAGIVTPLLSLGLLVAISVFAFQSSWNSYVRGEIQYGVVHYPIWLSYFPIAIGCLVIALRLMHHILMMIRFGKDDFVKVEGDVAE